MRTIYPTKAEAMQNAVEYQKNNGGRIIENVTEDLLDEQTGKSIGTYGAVIVGNGNDNEPLGDSWESFYYEL